MQDIIDIIAIGISYIIGYLVGSFTKSLSKKNQYAYSIPFPSDETIEKLAKAYCEKNKRLYYEGDYELMREGMKYIVVSIYVQWNEMKMPAYNGVPHEEKKVNV